MTKEELLKKLRELAEPPCDPEVAHLRADGALLEFIDDPGVTEAFSAIQKWYA